MILYKGQTTQSHWVLNKQQPLDFGVICMEICLSPKVHVFDKDESYVDYRIGSS